MSLDAFLLGLIGAVWGVLALLYAYVPAFHMPGSTLVWGVGAALFLGLAGWAHAARR